MQHDETGASIQKGASNWAPSLQQNENWAVTFTERDNNAKKRYLELDATFSETSFTPLVRFDCGKESSHTAGAVQQRTDRRSVRVSHGGGENHPDLVPSPRHFSSCYFAGPEHYQYQLDWLLMSFRWLSRKGGLNSREVLAQIADVWKWLRTSLS